MSGYLVHDRTIVKLKCERSFRLTTHMDIELVYVVEGSFRAISEGVAYDLSGGDIFVAFPFIEHSYEKTGENLTMVTIVNPSKHRKLSAMLTEYRPECPVISLSELSPGFGDTLLRVARLAEANGGFTGIDPDVERSGELYQKHAVDGDVIYNYIIAYISELVGAMKLVKRSNNDSSTIARVLQYVTDHYCEPTLTVEAIAKAVGLSRGYVIRIFNDKLGIRFTELLHRQRIERARVELNETSKSISEIAYECGFSTIRSFNRVFREQLGMTPSEYRDSGYTDWQANALALRFLNRRG